MEPKAPSPGKVPWQHLVVVRPSAPGQFTAQVVGIPEIRADAPCEDEAIEKVRQLLNEWLTTARWVTVEVPIPTTGHPLLEAAGHADPNDPMEQEYLEEIARYRREVDERTQRDDEQACSGSSSTPTT